MKKVWFCTAVVLLMACTACSHQSISDDAPIAPRYECYVVDYANDGTLSSTEKDWWSGRRMYDSKADKSKTWQDGESKITLNYSHSQRLGFCNEVLNYYRTQDISIAFAAGSGDFRSLHKSKLISEEYYSRDDIDNAHEYAREKSFEVAKRYIDLSQYVCTEQVSTETSADKSKCFSLYTFRFTRHISNYPTTDYLSVQITSKGDIRTITLGDVGIFEDVALIEIETDRLNNAIENKLEYLYGKIGIYSYEVTERVLAVSPDCGLVVVSKIELSITLNSGTHYRSGVVIATTV